MFKKLKKNLIKLFSEQSAKTKIYQLPKHKSERESLYINTYNAYGVGGIINTLEQDRTVSRQEMARIYLEASQAIKSNSLYDCYVLSYLANSIYPSEFTFRALGWSAYHSKEFKIAHECIEWLSDFYKDNNNAFYTSYEKLVISVNKAYKLKNNKLKKSISLDSKTQTPEKLEGNITLDKLRAIYQKSDKESVVKILIESELPKEEKAKLALQLGKYFRELGKFEQSTYFADQAYNLDKSIGTLKGVYWAYKHAGLQNPSLRIITELEKQAINMDSKTLADVKKLRANYNSTYGPLEILNDLEQVSVEYPDYQAKTGCIAYILHNSLPYASGGYATRGHGLAKGLQAQGFDIKVINRPGFPYEAKAELDENPPPKSEVADDIEYIKIPQPRRGAGLSTAEYIRKASDALLQEFLEVKPQIVIGASNYLTAMPALLAARKLGIPFIYEVRGFWEITRVSREPEFAHHPSFKIQVQMESAVVTAADHVFTLTNAMKDELVKRGGDTTKITLLPNSCNPEQFIPRNKDISLMQELNFPINIPVIGYIGTFVIYEGLEYLAEACGKLKERGIEFRLLLVGNENTAGTNRGEITEMIAQTAERYGFTDWLVMPGRIPFEKVESYYSIIDIAPFPRKPWPVCEMVSPMKPLEALAMEKSIIVSSVGALSEMVTPDETGIVFRKGDIDDLADKLAMMIHNPQLCNELGKAGRIWVENERTWAKTSQKATEIITQILGK